MTRIHAGSNIPRLRVGSRGHEVRVLEKALKKRGLLKGPVDGFFDERTKAAVQRLEGQLGWKKDGVVGNGIRRALGMPVKAAPAPKAESAIIRTVNINVKNNPEMPQSKVVHDVRRAAKLGGLIGWNEIGPQRYRKAIRSLGKDWGHYFPRDGKLVIPNPISWKKSVWERTGAGFLKTHGGLAKVSPNRYITWVKLRHKKTGKTIIRMNTHLVSGAWSKKKKPAKAWRQAQWKVHIRKLKALVERFEKRGHTVIIGGDFNRDSYRVLGKKVRYDNDLHVGTHGKATLDYVMHLPDEDLRRKGGRVVGGFHSDHDAVVVKYRLKR